MNLKDQKEEVSPESQKSGRNIDNSRRSFSKKGLIAPVIMTLANRSAWGANACLATGFQSYAAAVANGQVLSHAAPDLTATVGWKSPRSGAPQGSSDGWADDGNLSSWPSGIIPLRRKAGNAVRFQRWDSNSNSWINSDNFTITEARALGTGFVNQLLGIGSSTRTIYDAMLTDTTTLAYDCATAINMTIKPIELPVFASVADYELFYTNCVSN